MYKVVSINKYAMARTVKLKNSDTDKIEECFDDSELVSEKILILLQLEKNIIAKLNYLELLFKI